MAKRRTETALDIAGSIITFALGGDVEMTIIVRDSHDDNANITVRSSIETNAELAKLLYRLADHFAAQTPQTPLQGGANGSNRGFGSRRP
jgi:hypothetical protein